MKHRVVADSKYLQFVSPERWFVTLCSVAYLGFGKGGHGERVEREPITAVWGWSPQRGPGAEPLVGGQGGDAP